MEDLRLSQALYKMMENMDFADYEETKEQDIENLAKEIKILHDNGCASLLQLLENITTQNEEEESEKLLIKINEYGAKLQSDFCIKAKIEEDIEAEVFAGTYKYEKYIETVQDAVGWILETYDVEALDIIEEWITDDDETPRWGLDICDLKRELEKAFD